MCAASAPCPCRLGGRFGRAQWSHTSTERSKSQSRGRYPAGNARQVEGGKRSLRDMENSKLEEFIFFPNPTV